ncbi:MAG: hypothetical protein Q9194_006266, partial [Teloschistes cf. exilis]
GETLPALEDVFGDVGREDAGEVPVAACAEEVKCSDPKPGLREAGHDRPRFYPLTADAGIRGKCKGEGAGGGDAEGVEGFGDDEFTDARPEHGFPVREAGIGRLAGALELDLVAGLGRRVGGFEEGDCTTVAELAGPRTELVAAVALCPGVDAFFCGRVPRAPFTIRGPRSSRGALWEAEGVLYFGSGGSLEVNMFVLGRSCSETPEKVPLLVLPFTAAPLESKRSIASSRDAMLLHIAKRTIWSDMLQNYPWGKKGKESLSAVLCSKTPGTGFQIDESKEYAEMWMGDYPILPAKDLKTGEELQKIVDGNKEKLLGKMCIEKFGGVVPFLPKILSIAKALPLQIHPNKQLSEQLHKENPDKFPDPNHKPEIAIALGPFEVFAGWKDQSDIQSLFDELEPLKKFVPDQSKFDHEALKQICLNILKTSDRETAKTQEELAKIPKEKYGKQGYILDVLPRLQKQYSKEDPGNLVTLLTMNFLQLSAGDAIYVPADAPHAYLSGDIVECMARSNNVLNTGFCPRADRDDIELFTSALTFGPHNAEEVKLGTRKTDKSVNGKTSEYAPPMSEFNMLKTSLKDGEKETIKAIAGPSVVFATSGSGKLMADGESHDLSEGYIFFVGQGVEVKYEASEELEIYQAYAE